MTSRLTRAFPALLLFTAAAGVSLAWDPPPREQEGSQDPEAHKHAALTFRGHFQHHPHSFIIERAGRILTQDGHANWAEAVGQYYEHLMDGAMYPDRFGPEVYIKVTLWSLVPIPFKAKQWSFRLCNQASMDHYYNPDTGKGVQLAYWQNLESLAKKEVPLLTWFGAGLIGLDGLVFATVDVDPDLKKEYASAVSLCQAYFDKALAIWQGKEPLEKGRGRDESAMFYLGAACHLLADMALVDHTYDCFAGEHETFESAGNGKGDLDAYNALDGGVYDTATPVSQVAAKLAAELAKKVHNLQMFQWVEGQGASTQSGADLDRKVNGHGPTDFDAALKMAIPLAERYTAGLIARFLAELQIPDSAPALTGQVRDYAKNPIPAAYVFYKFPYGDHAWEFIRTDGQGKYRLLAPYKDILLRPTMPGYDFEGKHVAAIGGPGESFAVKSPVPYVYKQFGNTGDRVDLLLKPLPVEAVVSALLDFSTAKLLLARSAVFPPEDIAARNAFLRPPPLSLKPTLAADVQLASSKATVGPELAGSLCRALLEVREISDRTLRSENSSNWFPPSAQVLVQVNHLVDLTTGQKVADPAQLVAALSQGKARLADAFPTQPVSGIRGPAVQPTPDMKLLQGMKLLDDLLPHRNLPGPDGQPVPTVVIEGRRAEPGIGDNLLAHGVVPVPSPAGVELEARIVPSPGYLGSVFGPPLKLTTDQDGQAAFEVIAGTHAGRIRVAIHVTRDPLVQYPPPSAAIEFLVLPREGVDVTPLKHPTLKSLMPTEAKWAGRPKTPVGPLAEIPPQPVPEKPPEPKPSIEQKPPVGPRFHVWVMEKLPDGKSAFLPGSDIAVRRQGEPPVAVKADAKGSYISQPMAPGQYELAVALAGYDPARHSATLADQDVVVDVYLSKTRLAMNEPPKTQAPKIKVGEYTSVKQPAKAPATPLIPASPEPPPFKLPAIPPPPPPPPPPPQAVLRLRVFDPATDKGVPGADILISGGQQPIRTKANENGLYVARLALGQYTLEVTAGGYQRASEPLSIGNADVERHLPLTAALAQAIPIPGVVLPALRLRIVDAQGRGPVPGAQIVVRQQNRQIAAGTSDGNGLCQVILAAGAYRVEVSRLPQFVPAAVDVTMAGANQDREIVLQRPRIE